MAAEQVRVLLATRPVVVQHLTAFFMEENMRAVGMMGHAGVGGLSRVQPAQQQAAEHQQARRGAGHARPLSAQYPLRNPRFKRKALISLPRKRDVSGTRVSIR